ncbi:MULTISPECIES: hypothetical protein [unclassified Shewanella]|uniref:hypothetical protein n=1 Tax=Shewanella TaxID=22 RepID=UPI0021D82447|nr:MULTISPECIES: hypothetical protein [unclassified Shewanella]MCU8022415.1 hypothetical protein [Shewanella sp. SM78]MCU8031644.1 hypothetical protein [Shewanella sp. SM73]MCU8081336.1 hypothetical protein [Shewanella sp. SM103]
MKLSYALPNVLFGLGLLLLSGCTKTPEWTLFYYPDVSAIPVTPLQAEDINGYYDSLAQCQSKAHGMQRLSRSGVSGFGLGSYQCGHLCEFDDKSVLVCKTMSQ